MKTYKYEELFETIPDDPDNVLLNIPEDVCEVANLRPGDTVRVELNEDGTLTISKV